MQLGPLTKQSAWPTVTQPFSVMLSKRSQEDRNCSKERKALCSIHLFSLFKSSPGFLPRIILNTEHQVRTWCTHRRVLETLCVPYLIPSIPVAVLSGYLAAQIFKLWENAESCVRTLETTDDTPTNTRETRKGTIVRAVNPREGQCPSA